MSASVPKMTGKTVLVTGATNGIGLEACVALAKAGATVGMVGRSPEKTAQAMAEVKRRSGSDAVRTFLCDFSRQADVRRLASEVKAAFPRLEVLLNNAGAVNDSRTESPDGIEMTFAVNHLGYFLLTMELEPLLLASAPARVVSVASRAHYRADMDLADVGYAKGGYSIMGAYGRSKLANVLFTRQLAKRWAGKGVVAHSLHPGVVATNIWSRAPSWAKPVLSVIQKLWMITPEQGARTMVFLSSDPTAQASSGAYWDECREKRASRLAQDDKLAADLWALSEQLVAPSAPR